RISDKENAGNKKARKNYKEKYADYYTSFGKESLSCYALIFDMWKRIEKLLESKKLHNILDSLESGADETEIKGLEEAINSRRVDKITLPLTLKNSLRIHNGQRTGKTFSQHGLLGTYSFY